MQSQANHQISTCHVEIHSLVEFNCEFIETTVILPYTLKRCMDPTFSLLTIELYLEGNSVVCAPNDTFVSFALRC
jgi:hypothetical protein